MFSFLSSKSKKHSGKYTFENFQSDLFSTTQRIYPKICASSNIVKDGEFASAFVTNGKINEKEIIDESIHYACEIFDSIFEEPILFALEECKQRIKNDGRSCHLNLIFEFDLMKYSVDENDQYYIFQDEKNYRFKSHVSLRRKILRTKPSKMFNHWMKPDSTHESVKLAQRFLMDFVQDLENFLSCSFASPLAAGYILDKVRTLDIQFVSDSHVDNEPKHRVQFSMDEISLEKRYDPIDPVSSHETNFIFQDAAFLEYSKGAVPVTKALPPQILTSNDRSKLCTRNLDVDFLNLDPDYEHLLSDASSHVFFVTEGSGFSVVDTLHDHRTFTFLWEEGDAFVLPSCFKAVHRSLVKSKTTLLYASDKPLFDYLFARPSHARFTPIFYKKDHMQSQLQRVNAEDGATLRNRNGILLSNPDMINENLNTLTHVMWSLLNQIGPSTVQNPHRHNSVAIDLCTDLHPESENLVYTLMGPKLNENGTVKDPIRMNWKKNAVFTTPPGWWHSHHNDSNHPAAVFPIQDAGLHTYMNTLDIQFQK